MTSLQREPPHDWMIKDDRIKNLTDVLNDEFDQVRREMFKRITNLENQLRKECIVSFNNQATQTKLCEGVYNSETSNTSPQTSSVGMENILFHLLKIDEKLNSMKRFVSVINEKLDKVLWDDSLERINFNTYSQRCNQSANNLPTHKQTADLLQCIDAGPIVPTVFLNNRISREALVNKITTPTSSSHSGDSKSKCHQTKNSFIAPDVYSDNLITSPSLSPQTYTYKRPHASSVDVINKRFGSDCYEEFEVGERPRVGEVIQVDEDESGQSLQKGDRCEKNYVSQMKQQERDATMEIGQEITMQNESNEDERNVQINRESLTRSLIEATFSRHDLAYSNVRGARGKCMLDPVKVTKIRNIVFLQFPAASVDDEERAWRILATKINTKCRGVKRLLKRKDLLQKRMLRENKIQVEAGVRENSVENLNKAI